MQVRTKITFISFQHFHCGFWSPTESVNLLTDHMSVAIILNPLKINLRCTMKNGNLAQTLHSLCSCMLWQRDILSPPLVQCCFCEIRAIYLQFQNIPFCHLASPASSYLLPSSNMDCIKEVMLSCCLQAHPIAIKLISFVCLKHQPTHPC